jgi:hypothetical protein
MCLQDVFFNEEKADAFHLTEVGELGAHSTELRCLVASPLLGC